MRDKNRMLQWMLQWSSRGPVLRLEQGQRRREEVVGSGAGKLEVKMRDREAWDDSAPTCSGVKSLGTVKKHSLPSETVSYRL